MGRYISLTLRFSGPSLGPRILRSALSGQVFRPRGLGAIDFTDSCNAWFLGGFGLESFVSQYAWRNPDKQTMIQYSAPRETEHSSYYENLAAWINRHESP